MIGFTSPRPETNENSLNGLSAADARSAIMAVRLDFGCCLGGGAGCWGGGAAACRGYRRRRCAVGKLGASFKAAGKLVVGEGTVGVGSVLVLYSGILVYTRGEYSSSFGCWGGIGIWIVLGFCSEEVSTGVGNDAWSSDDRGEGSMGDSMDGWSDVACSLPVP